MSWILAITGLIVSSVVQYLAIRKAKDLEVSVSVRVLAMFALALPVIPVIAYITDQPLYFPIALAMPFLLVRLFLLYIPNKFSVLSMDNAPNPGYPLIISKSYIIYTIFLAYFVFDSELNARKILGSFLALVFSSLIVLGKQNKKQQGGKAWAWQSIIPFIGFGLQSIYLYYLNNILGLNPLAVTFWGSLMVCLFFLFENIKNIELKKPVIKINKRWIGIVSIIAISATAFNLLLSISFSLASNPGYVNAASLGSLGVVAFLSHFMFGDELNLRKIIGVIGVIGSILLIVL